MSSNTIQLDSAIKQMKHLTEQNIPFKFSFTSYSEKRDASEGIIIVRSAALRKQATDHLLEYRDIDKQADKRCYVCLLMTFNNKQIKF